MRLPFRPFIVIVVALWAGSAWAGSWPDVTEKARNQTVYFNAWGGSEVINDYIQWAAREVLKRYGVTVKHVKVTDIGQVVSRILAEKSAGRESTGSVDLIWINGFFNTNARACAAQGDYGPLSAFTIFCPIPGAVQIGLPAGQISSFFGS